MRLLLALLLATLFAPVVGASGPWENASLRAVHFADAREGWAAGDQGVIWHTIDGGKTWERQITGTAASLRSLCFLTPYLGYAVGCQELPNRVGSAGVLLMTTDGGLTWKELSNSTLPGLTVVHFFNEKQGVVAGTPTKLFPSGVFTTENGGLTWKPSGENPTTIPGWNRFLQGTFEHFSLEAAPETFCEFKEGQFSAGPTSALAPGASQSLWKAQRLPANGLMHSSSFVDEKLGWAVGDLGTIQHTTDGGQSWTLQKSGGQRAALLCVHARSEAVPFPLIGLISGKEGYHSAAISFTPQDEARLSAAMRLVGGSFGRSATMPLRGAYIHDPLPTGAPGLLPTLRSAESVESLAKTICQLKPEVIVCDGGTTLAEQWVQLHVKDAIQLAADRTRFPDQAHVVKKLYAVAPEGEVALDLTVFHPELGDCLKDFAEAAQHLFSYDPVPARMSLKLLSSTISGAEQHKNLMDGIDLAEGGTGRRKKAESSPALIAALPTREGIAKVRRQMEDLFQEPLTHERTEPTLAKCLELLRSLPEAAVPRVAVDLGFRFAQAGQWTAARELFLGVAEHHTVHPEAIEAMRWLVKYQTSGEVRRRLERGDFPIFQKAAFTPVEANPIRTVSTLEDQLPKPVMKFINPEAQRQWHQAGLDLQPKLAAFGTLYAVDVETLLPLNVARRNLGLHARALGVLQQLAPAPTTYSPCIARLIAERNILDNKPTNLPSTVSPAQMPYASTPELTSQFSSTRPVLDGQLDEDFWKAVTPVDFPGLHLAQQGYRTKAMVRHDAQFLYIAVMCEHPEGQAVPKLVRRGRNADLRGHDRIEILLDLDRDYQTAYRLAVDHRGLVAEDCWGDSNWNPKWFVATEPTPKGWIAEMAIPFSELTDTPPTSGQKWAVNLVRLVPGVGQDSWGGPWDGQPTTDNMGLLNFIKK